MNMVKRIVPSIIAKNQKEFDERFNKVKDLTTVFQLDVMDEKFVNNKSLMFDFKVKRKNKNGRKYFYEAHLMINDPLSWIKKRIFFLDTIIVHFECFKNEDELIKVLNFIKNKKKKSGLAINPKTKISKINNLIKKFDLILIMAVNPGNYGSRFLPSQLKKVKEVKKLYPKKKVEVDGGMNNVTIPSALKNGVDHFVVGSYLQNSNDVKKDYKLLREILLN